MNIFLNPEVKRITINFILFQIILSIIVFLFVNIKINNLKTDILNNNAALAGKIISKNPDFKNYILESFEREATRSELTLGKNIINKYGYNKTLPSWTVPYVKNLNKNLMFQIFLLLLFSTLGIYTIIIKEYSKIFNKINLISLSASKAVEGHMKNLKEDNEGEFSLLIHNYNNMVKRLKLSIEALNKEKLFLKNIVSDISHQLKTPLSSLKILNHLMINSKLPKEKHLEFLQKSSEQIERMQWLIINLLKMAKMEVGSVEFNLFKTPIINTLKQSLSILKPIIEDKKQKVKITGNKNIELLQDEQWLIEAFTNIIKNCVEHTKEEGQISINLTENPLFIRIIIKDNGLGIDKDDLPHIFQKFYKGKNSDSNSIGIGLSLAKTIIEKQEGDIRVESTYRKGTKFIITFLKIH